MPDKTKLSIIVVTHNNEDLIANLFASIDKAVKFFKEKTEVIVIDNASKDSTVLKIKSLKQKIALILNKENLGYAKANNQGLKSAKGEYLLLLNSDVVLGEDVLTKTVTYLKNNSRVGAVTCKVFLENGLVDPACHRGFPTPWASFCYYLGLERLLPHYKLFSGYHLYYKSLNSIHEIDSPSGAFYLIRSEILFGVGYLDEKFFMYGEDLDWSYRIKEKGWKIVYNPDSSALHYKKKSGINSSNDQLKIKTLNAFYDAMKIFYNKHYQNKYPWLIRNLIFKMIDLIRTLELAKCF